VSWTIGARTLRVIEFDKAISATIDLPVLDDRGLWVCRTRVPVFEVDRPYCAGESLEALIAALRMVGLEWFAAEKYMEVTLDGNKGIPMWAPDERECVWPPSRTPQSGERGTDSAVIAPLDTLLAERLYYDARNPEGGVFVHLRILGSREQPTRCRVELASTAPAATYRYEVSGADSMEALEQALLTASVRLGFLAERLGLRSALLFWKSGAEDCPGTGLPAFPDVPYSEAD